MSVPVYRVEMVVPVQITAMAIPAHVLRCGQELSFKSVVCAKGGGQPRLLI